MQPDLTRMAPILDNGAQMADGPDKPNRKKKVRVRFRHNRGKRPREKNWTKQALEAEDHELDTNRSESVVAKGDLSRQRTVTLSDGDPSLSDDGLVQGIVVAMRGLFAEVDDGQRIVPCTVRRILRTRQIEDRQPVTVGDRVCFRLESRGEGVEEEGVIESVADRGGLLRRRSGRRIHTIVANVDQAIVVSSAAEPGPKPHLIDRYIVASLAGGITPIVCMNKIDLLEDTRRIDEILDRYASIDMRVLRASTVTGEGMEALRRVFKDKKSVITGQSGVGKSSILNSIQPGLKLDVQTVSDLTKKGRHTTTTARLIRLADGGYVVDTPGIRSLDLTVIPRAEFEAHFVDIASYVANCKFPDCTHTHERDCAVKAAVEQGHIHIDRYESYVRMFEDPGDVSA